MRAPSAGSRAPARLRVTMLLENNAYPQDVRVRAEAQTLARAGHAVTVIAPRAAGQPRRETVDGVRVRRLWIPASGGSVAGFLGEYAVAHVQLLRAAARELAGGTDVLHLHNPPDTLVVAGVLGRALGRHVVYDHHDLAPELLEAKFPEGALPGPMRGALGAAMRAARRASVRAASVVLVTNDTQRDVVDGGRTPVVVVRNGPPAAMLRAARPGRPGRLDAPRLLFLGALEPQDGVLELPALLDEPALRSAHLTVVGDGTCREALAEELRRRGCASRVRMTGRVPHTRVPALLADADVCVDPAPGTPLNHGSTMVKIAEYLAAGRPVVAYALRETAATAGDAARLAPCGDRHAFAGLIAELAAAPAARRELERRALARAGELVWERSEPALLAAYERLAGAGAVHGAKAGVQDPAPAARCSG